MNNLFPMFVKLNDRRVLVVGAGRVAEQKIDALLQTGAIIHVVARLARHGIQELAAKGSIILAERTFRNSDLDRVFMAVVATSSSDLNLRIYREAQRRQILCNVVDVPELCDFYYPAVVQRGDLQIAISTSGQSPSLAQQIRLRLEKQYGPGYAEWVAQLGKTRRDILVSTLEPEEKRHLLQSLASEEAFKAALDKQRQIIQRNIA
jgi:precorrin-2 dehydrogenase/sirohydrochlorin ferrochelatase